jgi:glycosyltransferase involved in cell wall biosynthesis
MSNRKVSIIVPCYNYGSFLGECLESVLRQTYFNWECIIVDNGSTDNTKSVAQSYSSKDPRFIYEYIAQKGVSFARNHAVKLSKGEYILPLDADDKIESTYIEKAVKAINDNPNIKLVYSDAKLFGSASGKWTLPPFSLKDLLIENSIFCTALYRKSDFITAGGYDPAMLEGFEDWDFWIRMLKDGSKVYKIPETLFYYRIRSNSRNSVLTDQLQLKLRRRIYENHKELYESVFSTPDLIFEYYQLNKELRSIKYSRAQKLGESLLLPLRFLKKTLRR